MVNSSQHEEDVCPGSWYFSREKLCNACTCNAAWYYSKSFALSQPSLSKPQVTLSATFRLPLKQTTSTATSSLRTQLTSPLLQSTALSSGTGSSKIVMLTGSGTKQQTTSAGLLAQLQQQSSPSVKQSMPTIGSLGGGQARGNNSSSNNNTQTAASSNGVTLNMPTLNRPKWPSVKIRCIDFIHSYKLGVV